MCYLHIDVFVEEIMIKILSDLFSGLVIQVNLFHRFDSVQPTCSSKDILLFIDSYRQQSRFPKNYSTAKAISI